MQDLSKVLPQHPTKKPDRRSLDKIKRLVIHTTDAAWTPQQIVAYDLGPNHISSTGTPTCTYHYYVNQLGETAKLVDESIITWHAGGHNSDSVAVCLAYKTDPVFESGKSKQVKPENIPSEQMMDSLDELLVDLCFQLKVSPNQIFGHRELFGTGFILVKGHKALRKTCPGMWISLDGLRQRVACAVQIKLVTVGKKITTDSKWGPASEKAFWDFLAGK